MFKVPLKFSDFLSSSNTSSAWPPSPAVSQLMDPPRPSSPPSLVSRARTALHFAAAKAEKVFIDITSDLKPDREDGDWNLRRRLKGGLQESADGTCIGSKHDEVEVTGKSSGMKNSGHNGRKVSVVDFPPLSTVKQLAMAIENGKGCGSMTDLLDSVRGSSLVGEKATRSFSAVKSLVLGEKDKSDLASNGDEEVYSLVCYLFGSEEHSSRYISMPVSVDLKDIRGAPIGSFVVRAAEIIGSLKSLHRMASFWLSVVAKIKCIWAEGKPIPHIALDEKPDLNSCLLHQKLQVINCCIARKKRRALAVEALESIDQNNFICMQALDLDQKVSDQSLYAKNKSGEHILRLGADQRFENLTMLETGEAIYSPVTQEGPVLTEEHIREAEDLVLRTGSLGHGCSQLFADMQAFKAANPGCILEDFIRWHSPPDWMEDVDGTVCSSDSDLPSRRGHLSRRMKNEGNLWHELWGTAKALPAVKQPPIFDEDLAVEGIFASLEEISPSELFQQLFTSILFTGFAIAETELSTEKSLSKIFMDCKNYATFACQDTVLKDNLRNLCKTYETVEMILLHPEDAIELKEQMDETISIDHKGIFRKIGLNFMGRDHQNSDSSMSKEPKGTNEKGANVFSNLFDGKKSLFSKKDRQIDDSQPTEALDENSWTAI